MTCASLHAANAGPPVAPSSAWRIASSQYVTGRTQPMGCRTGGSVGDHSADHCSGHRLAAIYVRMVRLALFVLAAL